MSFIRINKADVVVLNKIADCAKSIGALLDDDSEQLRIARLFEKIRYSKDRKVFFSKFLKSSLVVKSEQNPFGEVWKGLFCFAIASKAEQDAWIVFRNWIDAILLLCQA